MNRTSVFWLAPLGAAACLSQSAIADTFAKVYVDRQAGQLVVTMAYRGTNANHNFALKWGQCAAGRSGHLPSVTAEVLDDQWKDVEQQSYMRTVRFNLSDLPCERPARVTLRTAPRFFYTLTVPK
ncbi:MAG: hypothetical protein NVS9B2_22260 [Steroidobacteraceae bacterium]